MQKVLATRETVVIGQAGNVAQQLHNTHHQVSLQMALRYITLVPSLGLRIGPACEAASALACEGSMCHPKRERKKGKKERVLILQ